MEALKLGEALIEILGDGRKLTVEFRKAEAEGASFAQRMGTLMSSVAQKLMPVGILATVEEIGRRTIETAAHMHDLSMQVGISVENLSRLQYIGNLADIELEEIAKSVGLLSRQMVKGEDDMGKSSKALDRLGISARDTQGNLRPVMDVLGDIAERFKNMPDGPEKTATAMELFGRSGKRMIVLLNEGRDGLAKLADEAQRAGYVLSSDTAARADDLDDRLKVLQMRLAGVARTAVAEVLPALQAIVSGFGEAGEASDKAEQKIEGWLDFFTRFKPLLVAVVTGVQEVVQAIALVLEVGLLALGQLTTEKLLENPRQKMREFRDDLVAIWEDYGKRIEAIGKRNAALLDDTNQKASEGLAGGEGGGNKPGREADQGILKDIAQRKLHIATLQENIREQERWARWLDITSSAELRAAGASEELIQYLLKIEKAERAAERAATERHKAQTEQREREARAYKLQKELQEEFLRAEVRGAETQQQLADYIIQSRARVTQATLTGINAERAAAYAWFDEQRRMLIERAGSEVIAADAIAQAHVELTAKLMAIDEKYATDWQHILSRIEREYSNMASRLTSLTESAVRTMERSLSDDFFDVLTGKFAALKNVVADFFTSMLRTITDFLAQEAVAKLLEFFLSWYNGRVLGSGRSFGNVSLAPAAGGAVWPSFTPIAAFAGGGVVNRPMLGLIGEEWNPEAIVPMKNGAVPVEFTGERKREQPIDLHLRVNLGADLIGAMRTSPGEIIHTVTRNYANNGAVRRIRLRG